MQLSNSNLDHEELLDQIRSNLLNREGAFKAAYPGESSTALLEIMTGLGSMLGYQLNAVAMNNFMLSAFSDASIYSNAAFLGAPARRSVGAQVTVTLTVNNVLGSTITLPKYSVFEGRGMEWYTIEDHDFSPGNQSKSVILRQGERTTETFSGSGREFQLILLGENFTIDERFFDVKVAGNEWDLNGAALFSADAGARVYAMNTLSQGQVLVIFGNEVYGSIPPLSSSIEVSYAVTEGRSSNSSSVGDEFSYSDTLSIAAGEFLDLTAITTTAATGGADVESPASVQFTSPRVYAANQRAVRRDDYRGLIMKYAGAISAAAWGEYEESSRLGYATLEMMNRAFISTIPAELELTSEVVGTGNGSDTQFTGTLSVVETTRGSASFETDTGRLYDPDGFGLLVSNDGPASGVAISTYYGYGAGEASGDASKAFNDPSTYWDSLVEPTESAPIIIGVRLDNPQVINALRILSSNDQSIRDRAFPSMFQIVASTDTTPDFSTMDDWVILRGYQHVSDPGVSQWGPWVTFPNDVAYPVYGIRIARAFDFQDHVRIANVQFDVDVASNNTIDYSTGDFTATYGGVLSAPNDDIVAQYAVGELSALDRFDLIDYVNSINHFTTDVTYRYSIMRKFSISANVRYLKGYNANQIRIQVETKLREAFALKTDSLGRSVEFTDITSVIKSVPGVDYVELLSPSQPVDVTVDGYAYLDQVVLDLSVTDR